MSQQIAVYTTDKEYAKRIINALVAKEYHKSDIIRYCTSATDITVEFNISGGYQYNTKVEEKTGYTRIANKRLSYIVMLLNYNKSQIY